MREYRSIVKTLVLTATIALALFQSGCGHGSAVKAGFLSDYSRLESKSDSTLQYVDSESLAQYSNFIVDDVDYYFRHETQTVNRRTKNKMTQQELKDLTNYLQSRIMEAVVASGNNVVFRPGRGVARIRMSITDITDSTNTTLLPVSKMLRMGVGGAALEAEILDTMTDKQIAAIVETQKGSNSPFTGLGKWGSTKEVIDEWAERFEARLSSAKATAYRTQR